MLKCRIYFFSRDMEEVIVADRKEFVNFLFNYSELDYITKIEFFLNA